MTSAGLSRSGEEERTMGQARNASLLRTSLTVTGTRQSRLQAPGMAKVLGWGVTTA